MNEYYKAYEQRYKTIHKKGASWSSDVPTPIVPDVIGRYHIGPGTPMLEAGCGEGRDAKAVLNSGFKLEAVDVSPEAVAYCKKLMPEHADCFRVMDLIKDKCEKSYGFIYSVAVIHMLVDDADRRAFYGFIRDHLEEDGLALICSMGDGETEMRSDPSKAFDVAAREHPTGTVMVASTSCRMVSFGTFEREISESGLCIVEKGLTESFPEFNSLMYAVVKRQAGRQLEYDELYTAYCGVDCSACGDLAAGKCPGCRMTEWPDGDECPPVACCRAKGVPFCGGCAEFPCGMMREFYDESESHRQAFRLMSRLRGS